MCDLTREDSYTLDDLEEWLHHPLTPPLERHVPTPFDGTAHLVKEQNNCRPSSTEVNDGIRSLGITHWSMFQLFEAKELHNANIPDGTAQSLANFA